MIYFWILLAANVHLYVKYYFDHNFITIVSEIRAHKLHNFTPKIELTTRGYLISHSGEGFKNLVLAGIEEFRIKRAAIIFRSIGTHFHL